MLYGFDSAIPTSDILEILSNAKRTNESFSQVVIRLVSRQSFDDFIGCISKKSIEKLSDAIEIFRKERAEVWSESMEEILG